MIATLDKNFLVIRAKVHLIEETFFIPCEKDAEVEGCWISDFPAKDGSRAVYSGKRGEYENGFRSTFGKCIGRLMPQRIDSRQQPKSLAYRLIEARVEKRDASICRH